MKKVFKSKSSKRIKIKFSLKLLLISFLCAYFLNKLNIFSNKRLIDLLKKTSVNKISVTNLELKGEYLLNIGLNRFNDIKFPKEVYKSVEKSDNNLNNRVYVYNTHQTEEYAPLKNYNLTPTVLTASYILKDKLKTYGIGVIVEESDLKTDMNKLGYDYNNAYKVSRSWLEKLNNPNLDIYIDLHRDSPGYEYSNITVDGKDYAKIMFVVGTNYNNEENMKLVNSLVTIIESINKDISRGIFTRSAIYNQDYNKNCVLIEIGGPESTYESISNTVDVLALAIKNYLGE